MVDHRDCIGLWKWSLEGEYGLESLLVIVSIFVRIVTSIQVLLLIHVKMSIVRVYVRLFYSRVRACWKVWSTVRNETWLLKTISISWCWLKKRLREGRYELKKSVTWTACQHLCLPCFSVFSQQVAPLPSGRRYRHDREAASASFLRQFRLPWIYVSFVKFFE